MTWVPIGPRARITVVVSGEQVSLQKELDEQGCGWFETVGYVVLPRTALKALADTLLTLVPPPAPNQPGPVVTFSRSPVSGSVRYFFECPACNILIERQVSRVELESCPDVRATLDASAWEELAALCPHIPLAWTSRAGEYL